MASPKTQHIAVNDYHLTVYEWGEPVLNQPSVIFFHATGFHAHCWDGVIRHLDRVHCYVLDALGHGASDKPEPPHGWKNYGRDASEIVQKLNLKGAIGVGHSMGGNALTRAAAVLPEAFSALVLVDPVIMPRHYYTQEDYNIEGHFVLKRRRHWSAPEEMFNSFKGRGAFKTWQDAILRDYCKYGLVPEGEGFVLACAPEVEAHIYSSSMLVVNSDIYDAVAQIEVPVRVLRCANVRLNNATDLSASPTAEDVAAQFKHGVDYPLPDNTHFIPMESPELVAQHIRELML
jgi:lipase